ncbi:hypothetical protein CC80DRAFT_273559 [Byssothecium circinans]|uniref:Uncharacterized protein n=1 Tax=Byssothecium circinans TaxID=147558 RepID=A0A6A5TCB4_9PLEO|nr:hypothetical protein CC80DRAFT_273559 [Byssothecium circinans]
MGAHALSRPGAGSGLLRSRAEHKRRRQVTASSLRYSNLRGPIGDRLLATPRIVPKWTSFQVGVMLSRCYCEGCITLAPRRDGGECSLPSPPLGDVCVLCRAVRRSKVRRVIILRLQCWAAHAHGGCRLHARLRADAGAGAARRCKRMAATIHRPNTILPPLPPSPRRSNRYSMTVAPV